MKKDQLIPSFLLNVSKDDLKKCHNDYSENKSLWKRCMAVYKGLDQIVKGGYIQQHEREPDISYKRRLKELYFFNYSESVVNIFTHYLMQKPPQGRKLQPLEKNDFWKMFFQDADLFGNSYDEVISFLVLNSAIQGHMGVLVDKPSIELLNQAQEKEQRIYPYLSIYHSLAILDWSFEKNQFGRPELVYLKLLDDNEDIRIWTKEYWVVYRIDQNEDNQNNQDNQDNQNGIEIDKSIKLIDYGENPLGFVPFVWFYNLKTDKNCIGKSDLKEISRIDISLIKNGSQIEEIINYAAFPMMMKPRRDVDPKKSGTQQSDEVGVQSVLEYDPEFPESKPAWLTPEVKEAIDSVISVMKFKVSEIYRAANIGGLAATEISKQAKSGTALKSEFQILNSTIVSKAINTEKAENKILEIWLKWQKLYDQYGSEVHFGRAKSFNIEDLATDLENALTAKTIVLSKTFDALLQKQTVKQVLPSISEDDQNTIDKEIDESIKNFESDLLDNINNPEKFGTPGTGQIIKTGMESN